jgi:hypothetical protein
MRAACLELRACMDEARGQVQLLWHVCLLVCRYISVFACVAAHALSLCVCTSHGSLCI